MANMILEHKKQDGVTTLTMNTPKRLNGWTGEMMDALKDAFRAAARDDETRVLVLTGSGPYYCAGVNLSATILKKTSMPSGIRSSSKSKSG